MISLTISIESKERQKKNLTNNHSNRKSVWLLWHGSLNCIKMKIIGLLAGILPARCKRAQIYLLMPIGNKTVGQLHILLNLNVSIYTLVHNAAAAHAYV